MGKVIEAYRSDGGVYQLDYTPVRPQGGLVAGALACVCGLLGIFTIGLLFVPLAALFAIIGIVRGIFTLSASGIGLSVAGLFLGICGFVVSPTLWVAAAGVFALTR